MNADEALTQLLDGNRRYVEGRVEAPGRDDARRREQAGGQTPFAVVLGCADSRVAPELAFDQGIGDLFVVRVAGNTADDPAALASIDFGVSVLHCPLVLVLGHEKCGAVTAAVDAVAGGDPPPATLAALVDPIMPAVVHGDVDESVRANVRRQVARLADAFPGTRVLGARYALESGRVDVLTG